MSLRSLNTGASGMEANTFKLDTIANNIANAGTTGFKRSRANFEDILYETLKVPGSESNGIQTGIGTQVGLGTRISGTQLDFQPGSLQQSGQQLDLAIEGKGFFSVTNSDQTTSYTRNGAFTLNSNGDIVLASAIEGRLLDPPINIPQDATDISISSDGTVAYRASSNDDLTVAGQILLTTFPNPGGLLQEGDTLYSQTDASGAPISTAPNTDGVGAIAQGFLELSNVEPVQELVDLIKTQRNFELNSQVVQAADQTLQLIANLRRF